MTSTQGWIDDYHDQQPEPGPERKVAWIDWHARRYHAAKAAQVALDEARKQLVAEIDEWHASETAKIERRVDHHESALRAHAETVYEQSGGRVKHVDLPDGTRVSRVAGRIAVRVEDEAAAVAWCREHRPEIVVVKERISLDKALINQAFGGKARQSVEPGDWPAVTDDGDIVPGLVIERGGPAVTIKAGTGTTSEPDYDEESDGD